MKSMENLIHILNEASKAYYNGESTMTDIEYDKFVDKMTKMKQDKGIITDDYIHPDELCKKGDKQK